MTECRQCGKAPVQKNSSYSAPEKSVFYVPKSNMQATVYGFNNLQIAEKQTKLILAWNIIEQSAVTKKIDAFLTETNKQINSADIKDLRNTIIHLPENGCLCISDAVDFLTACSSRSKAAMCFNILTSLEYVELKSEFYPLYYLLLTIIILLIDKCGVDEDDMLYLFFIQVLGACREILSFRLREDKHPLESPQAMKKTNKEGVYEAKAIINDKMIIWQQVTKSKIDHPWKLFLEESGLKVSKIAENIKKDLNIDLHERIARNLFRNCVCYELCCSECKEPVLDDRERRAFIAYANDSPSIDDRMKKYSVAMLQSCHAQGVFGDETKTDENISHIVTTIEKLITARPLDNLVHLLYALNTEVLKQRQNRSCKKKAQNMKAILKAAPELLELPKLLGLDAKNFKDLDSIYDESMDQLFKQFFSSYTTSNLVT